MSFVRYYILLQAELCWWIRNVHDEKSFFPFMEGLNDFEIPDPIDAFTPKMEIVEELEVLRTAKKSLGGEALRPIEIDMDILVDAYPREGNFLSSSTENASLILNVTSPRTPSGSKRKNESLMNSTSKKTPNRRFFKSEHEREYARNLMKELVQIYILQGVHGKDAFRQALNETRRRIHVRRGECAPSPPPILSPVHESPYPKLSPPKESHAPYSGRKRDETAAEVQRMEVANPTCEDSLSPCKKLRYEARIGTPRTPSRVQSMVAAIQASPIKKIQIDSVPRKTPLSSRVKAVAESMENKRVSPVKPADGVGGNDVPLHGPNNDVVKSSVFPRSEQLFASPKDKRNSRQSARHEDPVQIRPRLRTRTVDEDESKPVKSKLVAESGDGNSTKTDLSTPARAKKHQVSEPSVGPQHKKKAEPSGVLSDEPKSPASSGAMKRPKKAALTPLTETSSHANTRRRKATEATQGPNKVTQAARGTKAPARKRKEADLETIPEDEPVVVPIRPSRRAKTAANEALIK